MISTTANHNINNASGGIPNTFDAELQYRVESGDG
jgi:hypothetical protein